MGRALRRQQERAQRRQQRQQQRPSRGGRPLARGAPRRVSVPGPPAAEGRGGGRRWVPRWLAEIISELRKVTWPTRHEVGYLTLVVIVVSAFFGAILGVADLGFNWIIESTVLR